MTVRTRAEHKARAEEHLSAVDATIKMMLDSSSDADLVGLVRDDAVLTGLVTNLGAGLIHAVLALYPDEKPTAWRKPGIES